MMHVKVSYTVTLTMGKFPVITVLFLFSQYKLQIMLGDGLGCRTARLSSTMGKNWYCVAQVVLGSTIV